MFKFEDLRVYQASIGFVDLVYKLTSGWPREELFGLTSQLRRAAVSIVLNISEGSSRTKKDFRHFLDMARGSCYECAAIIRIAKRREYLNDKEFYEIYDVCESIARMISALKSSIR